MGSGACHSISHQLLPFPLTSSFLEYHAECESAWHFIHSLSIPGHRVLVLMAWLQILTSASGMRWFDASLWQALPLVCLSFQHQTFKKPCLCRTCWRIGFSHSEYCELTPIRSRFLHSPARSSWDSTKRSRRTFSRPLFRLTPRSKAGESLTLWSCVRAPTPEEAAKNEMPERHQNDCPNQRPEQRNRRRGRNIVIPDA